MKKEIKETEINDELYKQFKKAYKYAMNKTKQEVYQGAEGLFHK